MLDANCMLVQPVMGPACPWQSVQDHVTKVRNDSMSDLDGRVTGGKVSQDVDEDLS